MMTLIINKINTDKFQSKINENDQNEIGKFENNSISHNPECFMIIMMHLCIK